MIMSCEAGKRGAEPYTKIVEELPQMRRETAQLVKQAVGAAPPRLCAGQ
jgi:hypothetical protein